MGRAWRYRRCPRCGDVFPAGKLVYVGSYKPGWTDGQARRACPSCSYHGSTGDFLDVREDHGDGDSGLAASVSRAPTASAPLPPPPCAWFRGAGGEWRCGAHPRERFNAATETIVGGAS